MHRSAFFLARERRVFFWGKEKKQIAVCMGLLACLLLEFGATNINMVRHAGWMVLVASLPC